MQIDITVSVTHFLLLFSRQLVPGVEQHLLLVRLCTTDPHITIITYTHIHIRCTCICLSLPSNLGLLEALGWVWLTVRYGQ